MKKNATVGLGCLLVLSTSCSTVTYTASTESVKTEVYNLTVADMDVKPEKASLTKTWAWNPFRAISMSVEKSNVTAELLKETNADVLVEPQYEIKKRGLFRGGSITVSGRPATYRNFHPMTTQEAEMVATVKGYAIAYPKQVINTAGPHMPVAVEKPRRTKVYDDTENMSSFVSLIGGPIYNDDVDLSDQLQIGIMAGRHGKGWGWYGKALYTQARIDDDYYYNCTTKRGFSATVGATWGPTRNFGLFFGAGVGYIYDVEFDDSYNGDYRTGKELAPLAELGVRYSLKHFNVQGGLTVGVPAPNSSYYVNYMPFVGIGYNF